MKKIIIYNSKETKTISEKLIELDLNDLSNFSSRFHIDEFNKIPNSVVGDKTILEWFTVGGISCWWLICGKVYRKFDEKARFIDRIFSIIELYSPDIIEIADSFDELNVVRQVCKVKNIELKYSRSKNMNFVQRRIKRWVRKILDKQYTKFRIKKKLSLFNKEKVLHVPNSKYGFICSSENYRRTITDENGKSKREEFIIQPILDILKKKKIEILCCNTSLSKGKSILKERMKTEYNWFPIEIFIYKKKNIVSQKNIKSLKNSVDRLFSQSFEKIFEYRDISLVNDIKPLIQDQFLELALPTYLDLYEKFLEFFEKYPPREIIQVYEYGPVEKIILMASQVKKIKSYAIQHGIIHDHHPDYMHKQIQNNSEPLGYPIPDLTLVFGNFYKNVLINSGHYPPEKVMVIGNPSFYSIEKFYKKLSKTKILKKNRIWQKKIVLIPLDYSFSKSKINPGRLILTELKENFKREDVLILVRPHPADNFNQEFLDQLYPNNIFRCSQNSLFEDIVVSDLIVTSGSTVSIDAAFFSKSIIFADVLKEKHAGDIQEYMFNKKIAISCTRDEITTKITSIIDKDKIDVQMEKGRKDFLFDFFNYKNPIELEKLL